jgi:ComF family protein
VRIGSVQCARCGAPTVVPVARCRECSGRRLAFAQARAAIVYDARARALVRAWKEHGVRRLASPAAQLVLAQLPRPQVDALAALPADSDRALRRGRHPAYQLAELLGEAWELPLDTSLVRVRPLPRQRGLTVADRRRNVRDAFAAASAPPRTIALVDDVFTTGATVDAAARALRRAGARRVDVVTLARVCRLH